MIMRLLGFFLVKFGHVWLTTIVIPFLTKCDTMETTIIFNRKGILNKDGKGLVEIQIYLTRTNRPCRSTGIRVLPKYWDDKKSCVKRSHQNHDFLNKQILAYKLEIERNLLNDQIVHFKTSVANLDAFGQQINLTELIELYISDLKESEVAAAGTIKNHEIKLKNLKLFETYSRKIFTAASFDCVVAEKFIDWFCETKNTKFVTSANRNVSFYKLALLWAVKKGKIKNFALFAFTGQKDKNQDPVYLTKEEFKNVLNTNFQSDYLNRIKDLFVFQCLTGLSYSDVWGDFKIVNVNDKKAIQGTRHKNNQPFFVPLSPIANELLEKYDYNLPKYENAVYNRILKEIASLCGIDKRITTHTARKTFATLKNDEGWTRESISMMLGHSSVKTTEAYYLGKSFKRIENEMEKRG